MRRPLTLVNRNSLKVVNCQPINLCLIMFQVYRLEFDLPTDDKQLAQ